ncbi:VOC family protein [Brucella sp. JSBI001]|uniref:VOC family protein n=1 Tax=Brucella sp. JSBI001 TaxID=2886044 RepID=UPI00223209F4|nr:VOC family protein [Brucella sp. JSBI001]UZD69384.1 VOC family protein [Brucella sp. JSBI001]
MSGEGFGIDHTGIGVADLNRSARFYDAALGALGMRRLMQVSPEGAFAAPGEALGGIGYGSVFPVFWIDIAHPHGQRNHTAFRAGSRAEVDAFHTAALAAGGTDNGAPGIRPTSEGNPPGYYAAFILDPDGNNIEALFREQGF